MCTPSTTSQRTVESRRYRNVRCTGGNASTALISICEIMCIPEAFRCKKWWFENNWSDDGEEKSLVTVNMVDMVSVHCKMDNSNQEMAVPAVEMDGQQQSEQNGESLKYIVISSEKCVLLIPLNHSRRKVIVDSKLSLCAVYSYSCLFDAAVDYRLSCLGLNVPIELAYVMLALWFVNRCEIVVDVNPILSYPRKYLYCITRNVLEFKLGIDVSTSSHRCTSQTKYIKYVVFGTCIRKMSTLIICVYMRMYRNKCNKCGGNWRISYRE